MAIGESTHTHPTKYQPITPKVGDKFRVLKPIQTNFSDVIEVGFITTVVMTNSSSSNASMTYQNDSSNLWLDKDINYFTTEYLEPVEGERKIEVLEGYLDPISTTGYIKTDIKNNKQTIMQKLTSALKKALSSDLQVLYKTGIINGGLELSTQGESTYTKALFSNEGDHKKAVAEMVEAAQEELKDEA